LGRKGRALLFFFFGAVPKVPAILRFLIIHGLSPQLRMVELYACPMVFSNELDWAAIYKPSLVKRRLTPQSIKWITSWMGIALARMAKAVKRMGFLLG
jgi:hypothetical protein